MGKKAKEHRKKVQARNARIQTARKQLGKELQAEMLRQQEEARNKAIAENYDIINRQLPENKKQEVLEQSGVRFGS